MGEDVADGVAGGGQQRYGEEQKEEFDIRMPNLPEYDKEMKLAFEKEVLGIYISGHPLEEYMELWQKHITNTTHDFALDEETGSCAARDGENAVVGGMITNKTIKYTKNDQVMAFLTLEDLVGNVEIVVFPKDYERYASLLYEDAKVFVRGRISVEEEKSGKLICSQIASFEEAAESTRLFVPPVGRYTRPQNVPSLNAPSPNANKQGGLPQGLWIQFEDAGDYAGREKELLDAIADSDGREQVVIYLKSTKNYKILPSNRNVNANQALRDKLSGIFGQENVKYVTKAIEKR